ncbi:Fatty acyl-CoA reductase [Gryllus bimaculatus]|nr:Fatty acyl-CoA reductase [Gryllus bimaculatus]
MPAAVAAAAGDDRPGVAEWLAGRSVLVTGATGFLGQLLVEKLLRSCPEVATIYLLVRERRGEPPQKRIDRILDDQLFDRVRCRRDKLVLVSGDLSEPDLGLKPEDRAKLVRSVNVILHSAATVRFDAPLRTAAAINVRATRELLRLAHEMKGLLERVYKPRMSCDQLLNIVEALDDETLDRITPELMRPWPNSYVFTKAIAEDVVLRESKGLPVCVIRPSMVVGTSQEPVPGWINNINGPAGVMIGSGLGLLRTLHLDTEISDLIPADLEGEEIPVYNCVSSARNPISWDKVFEISMENGFHYPSEHCIWYFCLFRNKSLLMHYILRVLLHLIPAIIVDTFLRIAGKKPMLWKAYGKIHKFLDITDYFRSHEWTFTDTNMQSLWSELKESDKKIFPCNAADLDWEENIKNWIPGMRMYFLKDPLNTVEKAKVKYNRLKLMHYTLVAALWLLNRCIINKI